MRKVFRIRQVGKKIVISEEDMRYGSLKTEGEIEGRKVKKRRSDDWRTRQVGGKEGNK